MKRLLMAVAVLGVFAAVVAATASATIPVTVTPVAPTPSEPITVVADVTYEGAATLAVYAVPNVTCEEEFGSDSWVEGDTTGPGAYSAELDALPAGDYAVQVELFTGEEFIDWGCVELTVAAPPVVPALPSDETASSYLCWNREMVNPVAYIDKEADTMWKTGNYFEPQAILGNVEGGTNVGAYHLVCNAPSTVKITAESIGGSGEVYDAAVTALYHAQHAGANDLNLYHIWK